MLRVALRGRRCAVGPAAAPEVTSAHRCHQGPIIRPARGPRGRHSRRPPRITTNGSVHALSGRRPPPDLPRRGPGCTQRTGATNAPPRARRRRHGRRPRRIHRSRGSRDRCCDAAASDAGGREAPVLPLVRERQGGSPPGAAEGASRQRAPRQSSISCACSVPMRRAPRGPRRGRAGGLGPAPALRCGQARRGAGADFPCGSPATFVHYIVDAGIGRSASGALFALRVPRASGRAVPHAWRCMTPGAATPHAARQGDFGQQRLSWRGRAGSEGARGAEGARGGGSAQRRPGGERRRARRQGRRREGP